MISIEQDWRHKSQIDIEFKFCQWRKRDVAIISQIASWHDAIFSERRYDCTTTGCV